MNFLIVRRRHSRFKKNGNASVQGNLDVAVPGGRRKDRLASHWTYAFINRHHLLRQERMLGSRTGRERWDLHHTLAFRSVPPTSPLPAHRSLRAQNLLGGRRALHSSTPRHHPVERVVAGRLTSWAVLLWPVWGLQVPAPHRWLLGSTLSILLFHLSFEYPNALEMASALQSRQLGLKRVQNDQWFIKEWDRQR